MHVKYTFEWIPGLIAPVAQVRSAGPEPLLALRHGDQLVVAEQEALVGGLNLGYVILKQENYDFYPTM